MGTDLGISGGDFNMNPVQRKNIGEHILKEWCLLSPEYTQEAMSQNYGYEAFKYIDRALYIYFKPKQLIFRLSEI